MIENQQTAEQKLKDAGTGLMSLVTALGILAKERNEIQEKIHENAGDSQLKSQLKNVTDEIASCKLRMSEKSHEISLAKADLDKLEEDIEDYSIDVSFDPNFSGTKSQRHSPAPLAEPVVQRRSPSEADEMLEIQNIAEEIVPIAEHDFMLAALDLGPMAEEKRQILANLAQKPNDLELLRKLKEVGMKIKRQLALLVQKSNEAAEAQNDLAWINKEVVAHFGNSRVVLDPTLHHRDSSTVNRDHISSPNLQIESFAGQINKSSSPNAIESQTRSSLQATTPNVTLPHQPLNTRRRLTYSASPNISREPTQQTRKPVKRRLTYNSLQSDGSSLMTSKSTHKSLDELEYDVEKAREDVLRLRKECNVVEEAFDELRKNKQDYEQKSREYLDEIEKNYERQEALVKSKRMMVNKAEKEYSRINKLLKEEYDFYTSDSAGWVTIEGSVDTTTSESSVQRSEASRKSPKIVISPATLEGLEFSLSSSSNATSDHESNLSSFFDHQASLNNNQTVNQANIREVRRWRNLQTETSPSNISESSINFSNVLSSTRARSDFNTSDVYSDDSESYYLDTSSLTEIYGSYQDTQTLKEERMEVAKRRRDTPARQKRETFDAGKLKNWRTKLNESSIELSPAQEVSAQVQNFLGELVTAHNVCNYWQDIVQDPDAEDQSEEVLLEKAATYREAIDKYNTLVREGENFLTYIMENPDNYSPEVLVYVRHVLNVLGLPSPAIDRPTHAPEPPFNTQTEE